MGIGRLFAFLTLELRLPPHYVLREMTRYELTLLLENSNYAHRQEWEQTRQQMYVVAQVNSRKKLKPSDIMTFEWEQKEHDEQTRAASTNAEKERLRTLADRLRPKQ